MKRLATRRISFWFYHHLFLLFLTFTRSHITRDDQMINVKNSTTIRTNCTTFVNVNRSEGGNCELVTTTKEEFYDVHCGLFNVSRQELSEENITFCYPFGLDFLKCFKWKLDSHEFQIVTNHELATSFNLGLTNVKLGFYHINFDGSVYVCVPKTLLPSSGALQLDLVFFVCCVVSAVVVTTCFVSYLICPFRRHDSKSQICHMVSVLSFYVVILTFQTSPSNSSYSSCFSSLNEFCIFVNNNWFNVISYDVWTKFRPKKTCGRVTTDSNRAFYCRFLYAWGLAVLLLSAQFILIYTRIITDSFFITPTYYAFTWPTIYYFICLSVMQCVNIIAFVITNNNIRNMSEKGKDYVDVNEKIIASYRQLFIVSSILYGLIFVQRIPINSAISITADFFIILQGFCFSFIYGTNSLNLMLKQCCNKLVNRNKVNNQNK